MSRVKINYGKNFIRITKNNPKTVMVSGLLWRPRLDSNQRPVA